jgi:hypothetical protein
MDAELTAEEAHREYLVTVCAYVVTFDDGLRNRLLRSEPGTRFRIDGSCSPGMQRLIQGHGLRYWVSVARKLGPATAVVTYWAEEFPSVRDEAVIFLAADLGLTDLLAQKRQEDKQAEPDAAADAGA